MRRMLFGLALTSMIGWSTPSILGFCGFYVAKADTKLFNKASQVVLVRDGDRIVMTMANDFEGDPKEFAVVIPVPTFLTRGQIHVGDKALIDHLDAYSAPRLVEYFDQNPCARFEYRAAAPPMAAVAETVTRDSANRAKALGVTIEARYTVGEYDILILSAQQSSGLETWLRQSGYRIPAGASDVIASYLKQNMRFFFVAKVNLGEQTRLGVSYLRPLQIAYESPKFMLPIRLGMVNAKGQQELFVYALTRNGRVETTNYRTAKLPVDMDLPVYLKEPNEFTSFYKAMFARQVDAQDGRAVFLEYAWDMKWCDPCAADPLSNDELRHLGVFWSGDGDNRPPNVFLSRLHVRYDNAHFPEDLVFQETGDRAKLSGTLRAAPCLDRWRGVQRRNRVSRGAGRTARPRSRPAVAPDRLEHRGRSSKDGSDAPVRVQPAAWWERPWRK